LRLPKAKLWPVPLCPRSTFEHGGPGGSEGTESLRIGIPEEVKINANRIVARAFYCVVLDRVFEANGRSGARFREARGVRPASLAAVQALVRRRLSRACARHALLERAGPNRWAPRRTTTASSSGVTRFAHWPSLKPRFRLTPACASRRTTA